MSGNIVVVTYITTYLMIDHFMRNIHNHKIIKAKKKNFYQLFTSSNIW